ncbi:MAG: hypothetical protein NZM11_00710 [Anaerolineales bacterium]|nr:hypothetical protein [Anaerolineales bacterium]
MRVSRLILIAVLSLWPIALTNVPVARAQEWAPYYSLSEIGATLLSLTGNSNIDPNLFADGTHQYVTGNFEMVWDLNGFYSSPQLRLYNSAGSCSWWGLRLEFYRETTIGVLDGNWTLMTFLGPETYGLVYGPLFSQPAFRYLRVRSIYTFGECATIGQFGLGGITLTTPTPTPTPTPAPATPFPVLQACIPANMIATSTPTRAAPTATPYGTRTPQPSATPTATNTPGPTPTRTPADFNVLANFDTGLAPWNVNSRPPPVTHSSQPGQDGRPGFALLTFGADGTPNEPGEPMSFGLEPGNVLVYQSNGAPLPRPLRVVADVQFPQLLAGMYAYFMVYYFHDEGLGQGRWVLAGYERVNVAWHRITVHIEAPPNRVVRAIAVRGVVGASSINHPLGFIPMEWNGGVQVDNLRIAGGRLANDPVAVGLPVCAGSGGIPGTGTTRPIQMCTIAANNINVFRCPTPSNLVDIGLWISWLRCNIQTYFNFSAENHAQVMALMDRNKRHQPFTAILDLTQSLVIVGEAVRELSAMPSANDIPAPDWTRLLDARVLDEFSQVGPPGSDDQAAFEAAQRACPAVLQEMSRTMAPAMCYGVYALKGTFANSIAQFMFDVACYLWTINLFLNLLANRNELGQDG